MPGLAHLSEDATIELCEEAAVSSCMERTNNYLLCHPAPDPSSPVIHGSGDDKSAW